MEILVAEFVVVLHQQRKGEMTIAWLMGCRALDLHVQLWGVDPVPFESSADYRQVNGLLVREGFRNPETGDGSYRSHVGEAEFLFLGV